MIKVGGKVRSNGRHPDIPRGVFRVVQTGTVCNTRVIWVHELAGCYAMDGFEVLA